MVNLDWFTFECNKSVFVEFMFHFIFLLYFTSKLSRASAYVMDPEKLNSIYSKVICSPAITRQNLCRKTLTSQIIDNINDEDDIQFFESLKKKMNAGPLTCLKNKYESKKSYTTRKRKHSFNDESTNIIKRFNEAIENNDHVKVNSIKFHSQEKEIGENSTSCIHNNDSIKSINMNVDNKSYTLERDFTIMFQPKEAS